MQRTKNRPKTMNFQSNKYADSEHDSDLVEDLEKVRRTIGVDRREVLRILETRVECLDLRESILILLTSLARGSKRSEESASTLTSSP